MKVARRIAVALLGVLILAYMGYHTIVVPYQSIKTETAYAFTAKDMITADSSLIIRSEKPVEISAKGVYSYRIENGSRVANGSVIADVYSDEAAAETKRQLSALERRIEALSAYGSASTTVVVSLDRLNKQTQQKLNDVLQSASYGDLSNVSDKADEYLALLNRIDSATGEGSDCSELIAALTKQKADLEGSIGLAAGEVAAPCAGYFVSSVDGYENELTPDMIGSITADSFDKYKADSSVNNDAYAGKVVSDMQWYIAVKLPFDKALLFSKDASLTVELPTAAADEVPVTVETVNKTSKDNEAVVVFKCEYMNAELSMLRTPNVKIIMKKYSGLRVSSNAVRAENGKKGVYVSNGSYLKFTPVNVLYSGNGYVVCEKKDPLDEGLHMYDDIVVKGKKLYDGKPL